MVREAMVSVATDPKLLCKLSPWSHLALVTSETQATTVVWGTPHRTPLLACGYLMVYLATTGEINQLSSNTTLISLCW